MQFSDLNHSEDPTRNIIYLDSNATTPVASEVMEQMLPFFQQAFGNASSSESILGLEAARAVENARTQIIDAIGANSAAEVVFTSGATEANNLAIKGLVQACMDKPVRIVTSSIEHASILNTCKHIATLGWDVTFLPVDNFGRVDPEVVADTINEDTTLVSLGMANNEVGTINPISEIGSITRALEVPLHVDAAQGVGNTPIDVRSMNIDMLTMSGHKIYGPKGIGALWVRRGMPRIKLEPMLHGGDQERALRPGTLNVPGIVGLGAAIELADISLQNNIREIGGLRDFLWNELRQHIEKIELNGHATERIPNNLSIFVPGVSGKALVLKLKDRIAFSTGSACHSGSNEPSHVLKALGCDVGRAASSVRFGLSRMTTREDISRVADLLANTVQALRAINA